MQNSHPLQGRPLEWGKYEWENKKGSVTFCNVTGPVEVILTKVFRRRGRQTCVGACAPGVLRETNSEGFLSTGFEACRCELLSGWRITVCWGFSFSGSSLEHHHVQRRTHPNVIPCSCERWETIQRASLNLTQHIHEWKVCQEKKVAKMTDLWTSYTLWIHRFMHTLITEKNHVAINGLKYDFLFFISFCFVMRIYF